MIPPKNQRTRLCALSALVIGVLLAGDTNARADHRVRVDIAGPRVAVGFGDDYGVLARDTSDCELVSRQVWHEPVYEWREVWVDLPAVVEQRRVPRYSAYGELDGYRYVEVVVEPARRVRRTRRVVVEAGYYETVYDRSCDRGGYGVEAAYSPVHVVIEKRHHHRHHRHRRLRRVARALRVAVRHHRHHRIRFFHRR